MLKITAFCGKPKPTIVRLMVNNTTSRATISAESIAESLNNVHKSVVVYSDDVRLVQCCTWWKHSEVYQAYCAAVELMHSFVHRVLLAVLSTIKKMRYFLAL